MKFFDLFKTIYQKQGLPTTVDKWMGIVLNKWLSWDKDNHAALRESMPYLWYLSGENYFYLLYTSIPRKGRVPFFKKIVKTEKPEEEKFYAKIREVLGWSKTELFKNKSILQKVILPNRKEWEVRLGID